MTLITPVGKKDFDWVPKATQEMTKTASTGDQKQPSSRDALYEAAKKFIAAQSIGEIANDIDSAAPAFGGDMGSATSSPCSPCEEKAEVDVQKAVSDLVEKSNKVEEIAANVGQAVAKVEEAIKDVKDAAGVVTDEVSIEEGIEEVGKEKGCCDGTGKDGGGKGINCEEEIEIEIEDVKEDDKGEKDDKDEDDKADKDEDKGEKDELVKESDDDEVVTASFGGFRKISKVSPATMKAVTEEWVNKLGYPKDYVKLMVKNYEK